MNSHALPRRVGAMLLAGTMAVSLCACGKVASSSAVSSASSTASPTASPSAASSASSGVESQITVTAAKTNRPTFLQLSAAAPEMTPNVSAYTVADDFSNVINYASKFSGDGMATISEEAAAQLRENGFVVAGTKNTEFYGVYEGNRYDFIANFVTTDSLMHTYHLYFTKLLKNTEKTALCDALAQVTSTMLRQSTEQLEALRGTEWENAALRNAAFFAVAAELLNTGDEVPAEVSQPVEQELALIEAANNITDSPVMNLGADGTDPLQEDYTQYIPRSYYTTSEELTRYFKAMMWYGRLTFRQSSEDETRSALLMAEALQTGDAMAPWEEIYAITSFFVGTSDDLGVYEYAQAAQQAYGGWPEVAQLPQLPQQWDAFCAAVAALEVPIINSIPVDAQQHAEQGDAMLKGFRFMGQRTTLDAAVFQQLVYQKVGKNGADETRNLPSALDFTAALGNDFSAEVLAQTGANDFDGYTENMAAVKSYLADPPAEVWSANLYSSWVNTLRPLLTEKGEGWPQFMQNKAWTAKSVNSFLGSWTELKHDTVLYAKQVYSEMGGGGEPPEEVDDRGYVEPEPVLFARLAALAQGTADGLERYGVLADADRESLGLLAQLSGQLQTIAEKELREELPTDEEFELIRTYGGQLEHFWSDALAQDAAEKGKDYVSLEDFPSAIVTDVATDPNGLVLEEGTGFVDTIYVIVPVDGVLRIASGGVYSYYEFTQPIGERLTDKAWRVMLGIDPEFDTAGNYVPDAVVDVPHPSWTELFRVNDFYVYPSGE